MVRIGPKRVLASPPVNMVLSRFRPLSWSLPLVCTLLSSGCDHDRKVMSPAQDNHPTINLFGFEESQLHHIHNTVELHRNLFLVRYDPAAPEQIEWVNCPVTADYVYRKANGRRIENIFVRNFAELKARVPVNFARFEGFVRGGSGLEFNYVTIGSYELVGQFKIPADDPDCARATHYVVTLSVGAFSYGESKGVEGGVSGEAKGTGVGVGVTGGRETGKTTSVGDLQACMSDGTAFADCFTPLQVMMVPLAQRDWGGEAVVVAADVGNREAPPEDEAPPVTSLALSIDAEVWAIGSYMALALEQVLVFASRIDQTTEFGYDDQAPTVVAGYVTPSKPKVLTRTFEAGQNYVVFATGATDVADLDIALVGPNGEEVTADREVDENPMVGFTPTETGLHQITLTMAAGEADIAAMVVMRDQGFKIQPEILQPAFQTMLDRGAATSVVVAEGGLGSGLIFHENDWALTATVLNPGEVIRQTALQIETASVFMAVAHDPTMNIDLAVTDANTGAAVSDTAPDANPLVVIEAPDPESRYELAIGYPEGNGPTLATALILQLSP